MAQVRSKEHHAILAYLTNVFFFSSCVHVETTEIVLYVVAGLLAKWKSCGANRKTSIKKKGGLCGLIKQVVLFDLCKQKH
jgi:hypothetical protein